MLCELTLAEPAFGSIKPPLAGAPGRCCGQMVESWELVLRVAVGCNVASILSSLAVLFNIAIYQEVRGLAPL